MDHSILDEEQTTTKSPYANYNYGLDFRKRRSISGGAGLYNPVPRHSLKICYRFVIAPLNGQKLGKYNLKTLVNHKVATGAYGRISGIVYEELSSVVQCAYIYAWSTLRLTMSHLQ